MADIKSLVCNMTCPNNSKCAELAGEMVCMCEWPYIDHSDDDEQIQCKGKALFIHPSKTGRIMGSPVAGGRRPVLCPEHISKTTLARVMKFHGWIDLIQRECSAQITFACLISELLPFVVFHT